MNVRLLLVIVTFKWNFQLGFSKLGDLMEGPYICSTPNVRTVLFKPSHITKECWNQEEIALLYARRLMQEIIPLTVPTRMNVLVDYIKMCLKVLQEEVTSRYAHNMLLSAMSDAFGGYIQAYGFPICKAKFYEGTATYSDTKQLHILLMTTKQLLGTDGGSWTRPIFVEKSTNIAPLQVVDASVENTCSSLITSYEVSSYTSINDNPKLHVPMPFLDSAVNPSAVALPFRSRSLYSLMSPDTADIFVRYYIAAVHCLQAGPAHSMTNQALREFEVDFHNWLTRVVVPHLNDDQWYPGFGSVLRVLTTMSNKGIKTLPGVVSGGSYASEENDITASLPSVWFYVLIVALVLLLFWICVGCICSYRRFRSRGSEGSLCSCQSSCSSGKVVNTLRELYEEGPRKAQTPAFPKKNVCPPVEKPHCFHTGKLEGHMERPPNTPKNYNSVGYRRMNPNVPN